VGWEGEGAGWGKQEEEEEEERRERRGWRAEKSVQQIVNWRV